jgi:hypothetical protein
MQNVGQKSLRERSSKIGAAAPDANTKSFCYFLAPVNPRAPATALESAGPPHRQANAH